MDTTLIALVRDRTFIPLIYDYCDMWCARCRLTSRCLLFAAERFRLSEPGRRDDGEALDGALQFARAVIEESAPADQPIARLDLALCDVSTAPREPALGHPLEYLARHYAIQSATFLNQLPSSSNSEGWHSAVGLLELLSRSQYLIGAKVYRALVSQHAAVETPELLSDALGSAKIALVAIDSSLDAWRTVAATDGDARIAALTELLEALRTGIEMRFPEARAFRRRGLDDQAMDDGSEAAKAGGSAAARASPLGTLSARAIGSGGSDDGCAGECHEAARDSPLPAPHRAGASARGSSP